MCSNEKPYSEIPEECRAPAWVISRILYAVEPMIWLNMGLLFLAFYYVRSGWIFLGINVLLGIAAVFWKIRLSVDARLFADLAEQKITPEVLDKALAAVGRSALSEVRSLQDRIAGVIRLMVIWVALTLLQILTLGCAVLSAI